MPSQVSFDMKISASGTKEQTRPAWISTFNLG